MSLMCRSAFGNQKGDFELVVDDISGWKKDKKDTTTTLGWFANVWAKLCSAWTGLAAWVRAKTSEGKIALHDDEKEPLV